MGMHDEVLRIVDRMLSYKSCPPRLFNEAVFALLAHADHLDGWTKKVETAYTAMSLRNSRKCRYAMLSLYHSLRDYQKALEFLRVRFSRFTSSLEWVFALDTFLALRHVKKADALVRRCMRLLDQTSFGEETGALLNALADYFASKHDWENAIMLWEHVTSDDVLGPQALIEIAAARAEQAQQAAKEGLIHIKHLREAPDGLALSQPGNLRDRLDEVEMELVLMKATLDQCLPPEP